MRFQFNSSRTSDAYMRLWMMLSLVQIMACRLLGAKPLPEPMMDYYSLNPWEQISVKRESKYEDVHWKNAFENVVWKYGQFCLDINLINKMKQNKAVCMSRDLCRAVVTPLLALWRYCSLARSHRYSVNFLYTKAERSLWSQHRPCISSSRRAMGCLVWRIWKKNIAL